MCQSCRPTYVDFTQRPNYAVHFNPLSIGIDMWDIRVVIACPFCFIATDVILTTGKRKATNLPHEFECCIAHIMFRDV